MRYGPARGYLLKDTQPAQLIAAVKGAQRCLLFDMPVRVLHGPHASGHPAQ